MPIRMTSKSKYTLVPVLTPSFNADSNSRFKQVILATLNGWKEKGDSQWREVGHFVMTSDGKNSLKKTVSEKGLTLLNIFLM